MASVLWVECSHTSKTLILWRCVCVAKCAMIENSYIKHLIYWTKSHCPLRFDIKGVHCKRVRTLCRQHGWGLKSGCSFLLPFCWFGHFQCRFKYIFLQVATFHLQSPTNTFDCTMTVIAFFVAFINDFTNDWFLLWLMTS